MARVTGNAAITTRRAHHEKFHFQRYGNRAVHQRLQWAQNCSRNPHSLVLAGEKTDTQEPSNSPSTSRKPRGASGGRADENPRTSTTSNPKIGASYSWNFLFKFLLEPISPPPCSVSKKLNPKKMKKEERKHKYELETGFETTKLGTVNLHDGDDWELNGDGGDSCKRALATVFCHADTALLCVTCDSKIHAANKLASCQVRRRRPLRHDRDYHSANPLAHRHERLPVPFYYSTADAKSQALRSESKIRNRDGVNFAIFLCG
nr:zinc finger protein CONSTANS-LIKE 4-like [Ipomoea batatas]